MGRDVFSLWCGKDMLDVSFINDSMVEVVFLGNTFGEYYSRPCLFIIKVVAEDGVFRKSFLERLKLGFCGGMGFLETDDFSVNFEKVFD